jgi:hypothetical protein
MKNENEFAYRLVGSSGCEIVSPDGTVLAWTVDSATAAIIVALLNQADRKGLAAVLTE